ncbi:hypothetical protein BKM31_24775 [[Actinomadura] parvosata subsp. kistnae]|uniref:Integral membrane protein n=1 Tax=[Actinomadura] parvosata subsp. kistnae TaxID=1909395 RepID=A0A1V0A214_9ACTN|nr:hypothetical protein [Nonomuraea sp. ATCC 55076]AQZ64244.1 hypothetical protein BKM31_24775 [Nonomuraea sp. ATCC 55076]
MDGFLDETRGGVTELRVHGVSGTPPAGTLDHPHPRLVAGDGTTGFYRRWWAGGPPSGPHADVPGVRRREAYAWGNLTSGGRAIALWLLLLPFSLANLSYFMLPRPARGVRLRHVTEAAQRLFGLLLTGTLVGAVTRAAVDLVGWQCTAAGRACTYDTAPWWVRWLGELWGDEPSRRLAVTALVPLLVVVLLWGLARRTWLRDERAAPPATGAHGTTPPGAGAGGAAAPGADAAPPEAGARGPALLARSRMWHGAAPVWRLRVVHVAFSIASIAAAVAAPFAGTATGLALTVADAGVMLAAAVLATLPGIARRLDPHTGQRTPGWLTAACHVLRVAAPLAFLATIGAALAGMPARTDGTRAWWLPGIGIGAFQYAVTVGLGAFTLVTTFVLARMERPRERRALGGLAAWVVLMVAAGSANVMALGLLFWTAGFFGVPAGPSAPGPVGGKLFLDEPVWWTAGLVPLLLAGLVLVAVALWLIARAQARRLAPELKPYYLERDDARVVARTWALAGLTDRAGLVLGVLTGIGVAGSAAASAGYWLGLFTPDGGPAGLLATAGSWAMVAVVVALVAVGRRTYSDTRLRRTVGILWDICTFWPRAVHPLSPPCYTERVVPELMARVGVLAPTDRDQVVLSGHSQGSVLVAALVPQLGDVLRARVRLLTHGSPLRRLYAPFFPAYFGDAGLSAVRERVSWCNLYRLSDPIGGPVFRRVDPLAGGERDAVDRFCWDPARPGPGEPLPETRWHSGYWLEPSYDTALAGLVSVKPAA